MPWIPVENPSKELLDRLYEQAKKDHQGPCPDCRVKIGKKHTVFCDVARCLKCGGQKLSCECRGGHGDVWTGVWPGIQECYEKKYVANLVGCGKFNTKEPVFNLNRLALEKTKPSGKPLMN